MKGPCDDEYAILTCDLTAELSSHLTAVTFQSVTAVGARLQLQSTRQPLANGIATLRIAESRTVEPGSLFPFQLR
jgi:hypothetical protein